MVGFDPDTNVFWLDAATLDAATSFSIHAPAGSKVLINVTGAHVTFEAFGLWLVGVDLGGGITGEMLAATEDAGFAQGMIEDGSLVDDLLRCAAVAAARE